MKNEQKQKQMAPGGGNWITPNEILAQGWRLTTAILDLKGVEVPDTITFRIDGADQIRATRVARLEDLSKAIAALDEAVQRPDSHDHLEVEWLKRQRNALVQLRKRARVGGCPASTTVNEALFPDVHMSTRTTGQKQYIGSEQMAPNEILAQGWRLTTAILALNGLEVPDTITFRVDGANQRRTTRAASLEDLSKAIAAVDEAFQRQSSSDHLEVERLIKRRDALVELRKRASQGGCPASTTVIEALFPDVPVGMRMPNEREKFERWLWQRHRLKLPPFPVGLESALGHPCPDQR
jgi:hypothetical protein